MSARLILEDGTVHEGLPFGARTTAFGELVFNTSMTGYQEALTDPSYAGQLLMFTYPLIGNYGILPDANESERVRAWGCVVKEACETPWHPRSTMRLHEFAEGAGIPGISGVDTRALTVKVRSRGVMNAGLTTDPHANVDELIEQAKRMQSPDRSNLVAGVSTKKLSPEGGRGPRVVVMDYGVKRSILTNLAKHFEVVRVPWDTPADEVMSLRPAGVLLSNGPGDPAHADMMRAAVPAIRSLVGQVPLYGICLGHQLLCLAMGGETFKLKFGHRGSNQPVKDLRTGKVVITSQNHGFAVAPDTLSGSRLEVTQVNANDGTVEGLALPRDKVYSVQYHPEAHPGPLDSEQFFVEFAKTVKGVRA